MFKLYSFNRRHDNFLHPDKWEEYGFNCAGPDGPIGIITHPFKNALKFGRAFFCWYYEHGSCIWGITEVSATTLETLDVPAGVEFQWDGVRIAGLLLWEPNGQTKLPRTLDKRLALAQATLQGITDEMNGYAETVDDFEPLAIDN